jgi:hypothetical protein
MNGRREENEGEERMRGYWGVKKERERECAYVHTKAVFSSFRLSSEGLSHSAHIWNTLRNLTRCVLRAHGAGRE